MGRLGGMAGIGVPGMVASWPRCRIVAAWSWSRSLSASLAAIARSPALAYRSSGFLPMPLAITVSKAAGMPGRCSLGFGIGCIRCAVMTTLTLSPWYGWAPVRHSCRTHVSAYTSAR